MLLKPNRSSPFLSEGTFERLPSAYERELASLPHSASSYLYSCGMREWKNNIQKSDKTDAITKTELSDIVMYIVTMVAVVVLSMVEWWWCCDTVVCSVVARYSHSRAQYINIMFFYLLYLWIKLFEWQTIIIKVRINVQNI